MMPPAQLRPPGQCVVDVGGAQDIWGDEIVDLTRQYDLQSVGDVARHFLVETYRFLPDQVIELDRAQNRLCRGLCPTDDLDQRDQVRRIEGMSDDAAFRMRCNACLNAAHLEA
jgi:hypothetical protein